MHKLKAAITGFTGVLVCAGMLSLGGCGAGQQQADHDAQDKIQKTDVQRAQAQTVEDLDPAQKSYDDLANNHDLSKEMQILVRSRQAQLRLERITMMIADLRSQELVIDGEIADIQQLAMQVGGAQASVEALKAYDPGQQSDRLKTLAAQIEGSADQLTWMMPNPTAGNAQGKVTSSTLFAVKQQIDALNAKIKQNQADADAAHKLSSAKADEAESYLRRAEGETGDQQVSDTTHAANDRRDAAIADSQAATLANNLFRMQSNLDSAQNQKTVLESAVQSLNGQIEAQQTRWTTITAQIQDQQKVEQTLIGDSAAAPSTISALAKNLAARLQDAAGLREKVNNELNAVIQQLNTALTQSIPLRNEWLTDVREKQDDPDAIIWKQAQETLHPMYFNMQIASALQDRASVAAAKARIDRLIYAMFKGDEVTPADAATHFKNLDVAVMKAGPIKVPGIEDLLNPQKTGVKMPEAFGDIQPGDADQLAQEKDDVNKAFQEAVDAYDPSKSGATDSGPAADQRRNVALMCGAEVNRQWAQFAMLVGDTSDAQNHLQAARDIESQIDPNFALTATASAETPAAAHAAPAATPAP